jgi:hypothetical protein
VERREAARGIVADNLLTAAISSPYLQTNTRSSIERDGWALLLLWSSAGPFNKGHGYSYALEFSSEPEPQHDPHSQATSSRGKS